MADVDALYPFATNDGKAIPLDVIRPYGVVRKSFTNDTATTALDIPATIQVIAMLSNKDCLVQFATSSAAATAFSDGVLKVDAVFIPADILTVLVPPVDKRSYSIIGAFTPIDGDDLEGQLVIQMLQKWAGLSALAQIPRR